VSRVACSPRDGLCVIGCENGDLFLWNPDNNELVQLGTQAGGVSALAFSSDASLFASGSFHKTITI
jgi:hypothetical protein